MAPSSTQSYRKGRSMRANGKYYMHIIETGQLIHKAIVSSVPRIGEELRLNESHYCKVTAVVWVNYEDHNNDPSLAERIARMMALVEC